MSTPVPDAQGRPEDDGPRLTLRLDDLDGRGRTNNDGAFKAPVERRARTYPEPRGRNDEQRLRDLIFALGDRNHPEHAQAVNELIDIGSPAVSALTAALSPDRPWLTAFRAAEALAQIGDGRASGALISALRHPNSNVRWSAVRALAEVGDTRTMWALRRVANEDRGKTSWGDSVADTAQLALDRLQSRSAVLRFTDPIKTAIAFVAMFVTLLVAADRVQAVMEELRMEQTPPPVVASVDTTATAEATSEAGVAATTAPVTPTVTPQITPTTTVITSTVKTDSGNVRSAPELGDNVIGTVVLNDELEFLGVSGDWYLVRLGAKRSPNSSIRGEQGWVSRIVVNVPRQTPPTVPAQRVPIATPTAGP